MENNDSNLKPQQTGGLKLMTVFIAVLVLHVVVIGAFTIYHLTSGNSDTDLVTDKTHKGVKVVSDGSGDAPLPDAGAIDKTTTTSATPAATAPSPTTATASATDTTAAPDASAAAADNTGSVSVTTSSAPVTPTASASEPAANAPSGPVVTPPEGQGPPSENSASASEPSPEPKFEPETTSGVSYKVKSHDSLARIAHHYHTTVAKLKAANDLKSDLLRIGQKLTIPNATAIASNASASEDASEVGATNLGGSAPAPRAKPVVSSSHDQSTVMSATSGHHLYVVVKGDTLTRIAHKFHTTTGAILALNSSVDARKLQIGQKLRIPSRESRSASAAPAPVATPVQPDSERIQPRATPSAQLANFMP